MVEGERYGPDCNQDQQAHAGGGGDQVIIVERGEDGEVKQGDAAPGQPLAIGGKTAAPVSFAKPQQDGCHDGAKSEPRCFVDPAPVVGQLQKEGRSQKKNNYAYSV